MWKKVIKKDVFISNKSLGKVKKYHDINKNNDQRITWKHGQSNCRKSNDY